MQANSIMWKDVFTLPGSALRTEKSFSWAHLFIHHVYLNSNSFRFIICILFADNVGVWAFFNFALNVVFLSIICNMEGADSSSVVVYSRMFLKCALYYALMYAYLIVVLWSWRSRYRCWFRIIWWWYYRNKYCTDSVLKLKNLALQCKKL